MDYHNFTTTFTVDETPDAAFAAINDVRGWWSGELDGSTDKLGEEFTYRYQDIHYSKQRITEFVPGKKVVWLVLDAYLNFVEDESEWIGTEIAFELSQNGEQTEVRFTHVGLGAYECFDVCSNAWAHYVNGRTAQPERGRGSRNGFPLILRAMSGAN
jgi:Activator of Hsp90 ATPase homolog 1-like protein